MLEIFTVKALRLGPLGQCHLPWPSILTHTLSAQNGSGHPTKLNVCSIDHAKRWNSYLKFHVVNDVVVHLWHTLRLDEDGVLLNNLLNIVHMSHQQVSLFYVRTAKKSITFGYLLETTSKCVHRWTPTSRTTAFKRGQKSTRKTGYFFNSDVQAPQKKAGARARERDFEPSLQTSERACESNFSRQVTNASGVNEKGRARAKRLSFFTYWNADTLNSVEELVGLPDQLGGAARWGRCSLPSAAPPGPGCVPYRAWCPHPKSLCSFKLARCLWVLSAMHKGEIVHLCSCC